MDKRLSNLLQLVETLQILTIRPIGIDIDMLRLPSKSCCSVGKICKNKLQHHVTWSMPEQQNACITYIDIQDHSRLSGGGVRVPNLIGFVSHFLLQQAAVGLNKTTHLHYIRGHWPESSQINHIAFAARTGMLQARISWVSINGSK